MQVGVVVHSTEVLIEVSVPSQVQLALTLYINGVGSYILEVDVDLASFLVEANDTGLARGQLAAVEGRVADLTVSVREEGDVQLELRTLLSSRGSAAYTDGTSARYFPPW